MSDDEATEVGLFGKSDRCGGLPLTPTPAPSPSLWPPCPAFSLAYPPACAFAAGVGAARVAPTRRAVHAHTLCTRPPRWDALLSSAPLLVCWCAPRVVLGSVHQAIVLINGLAPQRIPKLLQRIMDKLHLPVRFCSGSSFSPQTKLAGGLGHSSPSPFFFFPGGGACCSRALSLVHTPTWRLRAALQNDKPFTSEEEDALTAAFELESSDISLILNTIAFIFETVRRGTCLQPLSSLPPPSRVPRGPQLCRCTKLQYYLRGGVP